MTKLIGFGSTARAGKDYSCSVLSRHYSVKRLAFADCLKDDLNTLFKLSGLSYREMEESLGKEKVRPLLVSYGSTMRMLDPDFWVKRAFDSLPADLSPYDFVVCTDVRFPNEVRELKNRGGTYIHILGKEPANDFEAEVYEDMKDCADFLILNTFDSDYDEMLLASIELIFGQES